MPNQLSRLLILAALAACTTPKQGLPLVADHERVPARKAADRLDQQKDMADYERVQERKNFDTQGEQEEYWARKLFQEHYHYQPQPKFNGPVRVSLAKQPALIYYGRDSLRLADVAEAYLPLFTEGTLYPTVAGMPFHSLSAITELTKSTNAATRRRFTLIAFSPFIANPTTYVLEVENKSASKTTDTKTFLQGAVLTFIRRGWLML